MRAFQISQFGLENLLSVELPEPAPGAGEVLIRVQAVSLNFRDLMMVRGQYDPKLHFPRIPVSDGAGEIVEIGAGVTRLHVGDRVTGVAHLEQRQLLDGTVDGGGEPAQQAPPVSRCHLAPLQEGTV